MKYSISSENMLPKTKVVKKNQKSLDTLKSKQKMPRAKHAINLLSKNYAKKDQ